MNTKDNLFANYNLGNLVIYTRSKHWSNTKLKDIKARGRYFKCIVEESLTLFLYPLQLAETHLRGQCTDADVHPETGGYQFKKIVT